MLCASGREIRLGVVVVHRRFVHVGAMRLGGLCPLLNTPTFASTARHRAAPQLTRRVDRVLLSGGGHHLGSGSRGYTLILKTLDFTGKQFQFTSQLKYQLFHIRAFVNGSSIVFELIVVV